jgi:hypothetical protein
MSVKSLRFEPYPANKEEAKKPREAWTGAMDIPEDTQVRVEALPDRHVVFEGLVTDAYSQNLQPGKYVYTMQKFISARKDGSPGRTICTEGSFYVDCNEEQWQMLMDSQPKMVRSTQTTDGPRLVCTAPGCSRKSATRLAAFLHEAKVHFGVDPLAEPEKAVEVELKATAQKKQMAAAKAVADSGLVNDPKVVSA